MLSAGTPKSASPPATRRRQDLLELGIGYGLILLVLWTPPPFQRRVYLVVVAFLILTSLRPAKLPSASASPPATSSKQGEHREINARAPLPHSLLPGIPKARSRQQADHRRRQKEVQGKPRQGKHPVRNRDKANRDGQGCR